jgi:uncharacterized delta-60 repeat protein
MDDAGKAPSVAHAVRGATTLLVSGLLVTSMTFSAEAARGRRDPTFGLDGRVVTAAAADSAANDVVIDPTGRIVAIGYRGDSSTVDPVDIEVARYLPSGELDPSFDGDGIAIVSAGDRSSGVAGALQADGKIVIAAGSVLAGSFMWVVVRLNTNGSLDDSFGTGGIASAFFRGYPAGIAIAKHGRIVVVGPDLGDFGVAVLKEGGELDPSFSGDGITTVDIAKNDAASDVAVQPNGRIVVVGSTFRRHIEAAALRLLPSGELDPSFGVDGHVAIDRPVSSAEAVALQADGKVLLAGAAFNRGGDVGIFRLRRNGSLDPSFGGDGRVRTGTAAGGEFAEDMLVQPNGKIVVAGYSEDVGPPYRSDFLAIRYRSDGHRDLSFGADGHVRTSFGTADWGWALARQADGKIVVAGQATSHHVYEFALVRYLNS